MADRWVTKFYQMANGQPGYTIEQHLFDLPCNKLTFTSKLNDVGTFSATVQSSDPTVQAVLAGQPPWALLCERTAVYVELNGTLVWGGILTQALYKRSSHTVSLQGIDWWGYFTKSRVISWNAFYVLTDPLRIAADLINIAQGNASSTSQSPVIPAGYVVGGNVGVQLGTLAQQALAGTFSTGVSDTVAWAETSFKNVGQAVVDMGSAARGFDWSIDVAYDTSGLPSKTFNLWWPRAGRTQQQQQTTGAAIVFNVGGASGLDITWTTGVVQPSNVVFAAGSGIANLSIASVAADPNLITQGWPLLENSFSFTDINSQALLDQLALAYLNQLRLPVSQPTVRYAVGVDSDQPLGSYQIGDDTRLLCDPDDCYPGGYDSAGGQPGEQWWRIIQTQVTVGDEGKSYVDVTLGTPPVITGM